MRILLVAFVVLATALTVLALPGGGGRRTPLPGSVEAAKRGSLRPRLIKLDRKRNNLVRTDDDRLDIRKELTALSGRNKIEKKSPSPDAEQEM